MKESTRQIILSCEHGGNHIPVAYRYLFKDKQALLDSHRGYDIGALPVARLLAKKLALPLVYSQTSRLLVELNRSPHHRSLFSESIKTTASDVRTQILEQYYHPYRKKIEQAIQTAITNNRQALHLSIHSFTPKLKQEIRKADIGLLYDPARKREQAFCKDLQHKLQQTSSYNVRRNYPYLGSADGLTTLMRKKFPPESYLGIEIEMNQKLLAIPTDRHREIAALLHKAIQAVIDHQVS